LTTKGSPIVIAKAAVTPIPPLASVLPFIPEPLSVFRRIWPLAGLVAAIVVNMAWMGFLGYGFFKLVGTAFF
jgi:hypothetical protein